MKRQTKVERETATIMLPREKLLSGTSAAELTDQELLAMLLKTGTRACNVLALAGQILKQFGSLYDLSLADWRELKTVHGLGTVRSLELYSMFEFGRRAIRRPLADFQHTPMDCAAKVARLLKPYILGARQECFYVLYLNDQDVLMSEPKVMTRGTRHETPVAVSEVIREALKRGASAIIVAHNHPGGGAEPSEEDLALTERLVAAGNAVELAVYDHVILGGASDGEVWTSLREQGLMAHSQRSDR